MSDNFLSNNHDDIDTERIKKEKVKRKGERKKELNWTNENAKRLDRQERIRERGKS